MEWYSIVPLREDELHPGLVTLRCGRTGGDGGTIVRGMAAALEEEREAAAAVSAGRQVERRKWKEEQTELLDQMLPAPTAGTG